MIKGGMDKGFRFLVRTVVSLFLNSTPQHFKNCYEIQDYISFMVILETVLKG